MFLSRLACAFLPAVLVGLLAACGPVKDQSSGNITTFQTPLSESTDTTPPRPPSSASGRTEIQNLAIVAGVSENDPELRRQYERLQTLCPPENASVGDMAVSLRQIVREESGRDLGIVDVMRQLATAQEGGNKAGMTCSETGGMLAELLIKGM